MRYIYLILACLFTLGCGMGWGNHDPRTIGLALSPPSITALVPNSVPVNSVPFTMTVNGSNFDSGAVVFWNGTPQFTIFVTANQLMAKLTEEDLMFWGMAHVYVRTGGQNSNTVDFDVTAQ